MNQRDRITMAMIGPDGVPGGYPQELEPPGAPAAPGDMPPPMPFRHNPRNLLHNGAGSPMSQEWMDEMMQRSLGGGGSSALSPETQRLMEEAINGPREYNEWDKMPSKNPRVGEYPTHPPLPPTVIPEDAPDWARTQQGMPEFMEYPTIRGKYTDT